MSKENLEQFIQQISGSEELQSTIGDEIDADAFIAFGAEHGCEFTEEDLQESAGLSDEELDGVAGGALAIYGVRRRKSSGLMFNVKICEGQVYVQGTHEATP